MPFDERKEPEWDNGDDPHYQAQMYAIRVIDTLFDPQAIEDHGFCYECVIASGAFNLLVTYIQLSQEQGNSKEELLSRISALWDFLEKEGNPEESP